ncbi:helix-turn-helix transcriptional regulator [Chryseobacterium chendengshani]|uniref:helix-turn-helix domain-containing protein n=1 Tax=Chryseobacterium sp. LJ668 TaxID=2864040 RepID=UPI001C6899AD|nr:response regulator transcription factor [Chryseobacterium sp. LJ668]MBW8523487.1 helix-turn-helix transcriptional regulator [Chryseobacterium sp. LJ668]QYK15772.1 helix-turn-helix transcriptional regulator [Chryseobacterium sp. LJ668]
MQHYKTLTELHLGNTWSAPEHPLFSMIGCQSECTLGNREFTTDCYVIAFKKIKSGVFMYGRTPYDHNNGSMFFAKPRQIIEMNDLEFEETGYMLMIHEDYLNGHELFKEIEKYSFFDYEVTEALHLSPKEEQIILELHEKIKGEYFNNPDEYSREIILSHISSILKYAQRFYKRQFIDRAQVTGKTASKFNDALKKYISEGQLEKNGLPNVAHLADQLFVSPRYLSDLLKQETGKTAMELIHIFLISEAKNLLRLKEKGITEIAYELGFENASYFTRLFKKQTGMKPLEFRNMNLN